VYFINRRWIHNYVYMTIMHPSAHVLFKIYMVVNPSAEFKALAQASSFINVLTSTSLVIYLLDFSLQI